MRYLPALHSLRPLGFAFALGLPLLAQAIAKPEASVPATKQELPGPSLKASDVFWGTSESLKAVTDSQIKVLQRLIDITGDKDPEKPDLLFRMAELYAEQEHYYAYKAQEARAKRVEAQKSSDSNAVTQLQTQVEDFEKREKQWLAKAVKQYQVVADGESFQSYKRMDQVLFYLAYLLTQQEREDLARPIHKRLIKDFPQSPYIPHSYVAFGDYYFAAKDMENALAFYDKVAPYPTSSVYGYACYKKGWALFNQELYPKALETFAAILQKTKPGQDRNQLQLIRETRKDLVYTYARVGTCLKAWPYLQRFGGRAETLPMLQQLAETFQALGKTKDAICVYKRLLTLDPKNSNAAQWKEAAKASATAKQ